MLHDKQYTESQKKLHTCTFHFDTNFQNNSVCTFATNIFGRH